MFDVIDQSPAHIRSHRQNIQFAGFALGDGDFIRIPVEIGKLHVVDVGCPESQFGNCDVRRIIAFADRTFSIDAVEQFYRIVSGPDCRKPFLGGHTHFRQPSGEVHLHKTVEKQEFEILRQMPYSVATVYLAVPLHGNPIIRYDLAGELENRGKAGNLEESVERLQAMGCREDGSFCYPLLTLFVEKCVEKTDVVQCPFGHRSGIGFSTDATASHVFGETLHGFHRNKTYMFEFAYTHTDGVSEGFFQKLVAELLREVFGGFLSRELLQHRERLSMRADNGFRALLANATCGVAGELRLRSVSTR